MSYRISVRNTAKTAIRFREDICMPITAEIGMIKMNELRTTSREPWIRPTISVFPPLISCKVQGFPALGARSTSCAKAVY